MKSILYRLSFKQRMWMSFVLFICFSVGTTGTASYYIASREIEKQTLILSQNNINKSAQALDDKLRSIIVSVMTLMISDPFLQMLRDVSFGSSEHFYQYFSKLQTPFTQMQLNEPTISSILVSTPLGEFFPTNESRTSYSFENSEMYQKISEKGAAFWEKQHKDTLFRSGESVISLVMEPTTQIDVRGVYVVVNVSEKALRQQLGHSADASKGAVLLLSHSEGNIIPANERYVEMTTDAAIMNKLFEFDAGHFEYTFQHRNYYVNYASLNVVPDWTLVDIRSRSEMLRQINWIKWATVMIMAISILVASLLSNMLSLLLVRPLNKLNSLMKQAGDHQLNVRFHSLYHDEVAQAGNRFNLMMDELNSLIVQIREVEQDKRKAEMKALQAQIDPHFLYNSLNTVFWKCMSKEYDIAKEVVVSLSRLFELGLNKGSEITTVEKEMIHVEQYLLIQQKCYAGLFEYQLQLQDPALLSLPVLKIILQPLVENSILHGFNDREEGGMIRIAVKQHESALLFTVTDNGAGMDVEAVRQAMESDRSSEQGYALRNVYHRLKLYYGDMATVRIQSEPHVNTQVTLSIPIQRN